MERFERLKLTVAYDGRPFSGWQSQPNRNGIQDYMKHAFAEILARPVNLHGAGRTDAGVHAFAQVAHVDRLYIKYAIQTWKAALKPHLLRRFRELKCKRTQKCFHAQ